MTKIQQSVIESRNSTLEAEQKRRRKESLPSRAEFKNEGLLLKMSSLRKNFPDDDFDWVKRGVSWEKKNLKQGRKSSTKPPGQPDPPLVLAGHGVSLSIHRGSLLIRNGFTHYPQKQEEWRFFPGSPKLPSRIVLLDADGAISFDVIAWLSKQKIPLVLLNWQGKVLSVIGADGRAPSPALVELQQEAMSNGNGFKLAVWLIQEKIKGSIENLFMLVSSPARESALWKLKKSLHELETPPRNIEDIRLIEGRAAIAYFSAWRMISLRWKEKSRRPIPQEWDRMICRQSSISGRNRHATHPVNAILNYVYGVLESQVLMAAVSAGLDTTIGYLHACYPNRVALVYDLMEPLRPKVEQLVLQFLQKYVFSPKDFLLLENGVCRLHPQLAKIVSRITVAEEAVENAISQAIEKLKNE